MDIVCAEQTCIAKVEFWEKRNGGFRYRWWLTGIWKPWNMHCFASDTLHPVLYRYIHVYIVYPKHTSRNSGNRNISKWQVSYVRFASCKIICAQHQDTRHSQMMLLNHLRSMFYVVQKALAAKFATGTRLTMTTHLTLWENSQSSPRYSRAFAWRTSI